MKTFNNFAELAQAKVSTGTPVRILKPALVEGVVEVSGEGLTLLSNNVFVPQFDDQEALTGRKTSILDDNFSSGVSAYINSYYKDDNGGWVDSSAGRTSAVYYNGQLWWPLLNTPHKAGGYRILSWSQPTSNPDILEISVAGDQVIQFNRFRGVVGGDSGGSTVSDVPPADPVAGSRWTRCQDMKSFIWYVDSEGAHWIEDNPSYENNSVGISSTVAELPPTQPIEGSRWTRCRDMKSFLYFEGQWIEDNPSYGTPEVVTNAIISENPPAYKVSGLLWTRCSDLRNFIWHGNATAGYWVEAR